MTRDPSVKASGPHYHISINIQDDSEFPSLSGTPQAQQQTSSAQSLWANPNLRATQQTPVQRPQNQLSHMQTSSSQPAPHQPQQTQSQGQEDTSAATSQYNPGMDDYRFGGQGGVGQLSGQAQTQSGTADDFPPLGGNGTGPTGHDRRTGIIQNATYGAGATGFGGSGGGQTQNMMSGSLEGLKDRNIGSSALDMGSSSGVAAGKHHTPEVVCSETSSLTI